MIITRSAVPAVKRTIKICPNQFFNFDVFFEQFTNNWKDKATGEYKAQFVTFKAFVAASKTDLGVYANLEKGDKISISYSLRQNNFMQTDGTMKYDQYCHIEGVQFMESLSEKADRKARAVNKAANATATATA